MELVQKEYDWENGATLEPHTAKKHTILKEYFKQYLITRCQLPQMEKFRIALVDGFSGAGQYKCGSYGSSLIFVDVLNTTVNEINIYRAANGMKPICIECLIIMNDQTPATVNQLKENIAPLLAQIEENNKLLKIDAEFHSAKFEEIFQQIKTRLVAARCSNVLFNLDQSGYSHVTSKIITEIMRSWSNAEIIFTFMIKSLLTFLSPTDGSSNVPLEIPVKEQIDAILKDGDGQIKKEDWLGKAERIVYGHLKECAPYVSPFSINNPNGWQYWLMHFANSYRAREVYNDVLHENDNTQAHVGKAGLRMLSYDPQHENQLYLFDTNSRKLAREELFDDIPRIVAEAGDVLGVQDFYRLAYSETPAHSQDIRKMMIQNPDLQIITETGGTRRKPNTIRPADTLKINDQKSMFFMFGNDNRPQS